MTPGNTDRPGSLGRPGCPDCLGNPSRLGVHGSPGSWGHIGSPDSRSPGSPGGLGSLGSASSNGSCSSPLASQPATVWLLALLQSGPAGSRSPDKATTVSVVIGAVLLQLSAKPPYSSTHKPSV